MVILCDFTGNIRFAVSEIDLNARNLMDCIITLRKIVKSFSEEEDLYEDNQPGFSEAWANINYILQCADSIFKVYLERDEKSFNHPGKFFDSSTCQFKRVIHTNLVDIYLMIDDLKDTFKYLNEYICSIPEEGNGIALKYELKYNKSLEYIKNISKLINPIYDALEEEDPEMLLLN